jgi:3-methyladenine DNA glycosylase AlkD
MSKIIQNIRSELKQSIDTKTQQSFQRFFKETVKCHGVKTATVRKIANEYWKQVESLNKEKIFKLCEELFRSDYSEEAFVVSFWLPKLTDRFESRDLGLFKTWIDKYINNWAKCDGFCNHTIGNFIEKYPESLEDLKNWTQSKNRWLKRAAAVSLIVPARQGKLLKEVFQIADLLLMDEDDMVQKGYGWMLKEASRKHQKAVFDYVVKHKKVMPRTALRYAIELMPKELKSKAMKRD